MPRLVGEARSAPRRPLDRKALKAAADGNISVEELCPRGSHEVPELRSRSAAALVAAARQRRLPRMAEGSISEPGAGLYTAANSKSVVDFARRFPFHRGIRPLEAQLGGLAPLPVLLSEAAASEAASRQQLEADEQAGRVALFEASCMERASFIPGQMLARARWDQSRRFAAQRGRLTEQSEPAARQELEAEALRMLGAIRKASRRVAQEIADRDRAVREAVEAVNNGADRLLAEHEQAWRDGMADFVAARFLPALHEFEVVARAVEVELLEARRRRTLEMRLILDGENLQQASRHFRQDWLVRGARELEAEHAQERVMAVDDDERAGRNAIRIAKNAEEREIRERVLIPRKLAAVEAQEADLRAMRAPAAFELLLNAQREATLWLWATTRRDASHAGLEDSAAAVASSQRELEFSLRSPSLSASCTGGAGPSDVEFAAVAAEVVNSFATVAVENDTQLAAELLPVLSPSAAASSTPAISSPAVAKTKGKAPGRHATVAISPASPLPDEDVASRTAAAVTRAQLLALPLHEAAWREEIVRDEAAELSEMLHRDVRLLRHVSAAAFFAKAVSMHSRAEVESTVADMHRIASSRLGPHSAEPASPQLLRRGLSDVAVFESFAEFGDTASDAAPAIVVAAASPASAASPKLTCFDWLNDILERAANRTPPAEPAADSSSTSNPTVALPPLAKPASGSAEAASLRARRLRRRTVESALARELQDCGGNDWLRDVIVDHAAAGGGSDSAEGAATGSAGGRGTPGSAGALGVMLTPTFMGHSGGTPAVDDTTFAELWDEAALHAVSGAANGTPTGARSGTAASRRSFDSQAQRSLHSSSRRVTGSRSAARPPTAQQPLEDADSSVPSSAVPASRGTL